MPRVITEGAWGSEKVPCEPTGVGYVLSGHKCMHRQDVPRRVCTRLVTLVEMA